MHAHKRLRRFKDAFKRYDAEEKEKEIHNTKVVDAELKKVQTTKDKPVRDFVKKDAKASKRKPINTHALLKGFI